MITDPTPITKENVSELVDAICYWLKRNEDQFTSHDVREWLQQIIEASGVTIGPEREIQLWVDED